MRKLASGEHSIDAVDVDAIAGSIRALLRDETRSETPDETTRSALDANEEGPSVDASARLTSGSS